MQSTNNENNPPSSSEKTSPASYPPKTMLSAALLLACPGTTSQSLTRPDGGQTLVLLLDHRAQSRGASLTPNISEWPNAAAVCSLSQVLEQTSIPPRFFLSSKACAGILRRAEKRGKKLPELLERALRSVSER